MLMNVGGKRNKRNIVRITVCILAFIAAASVIFNSFGESSKVSAAAADSLTLLNAEVPTAMENVAAFADDSLLTFNIQFTNPRANDSIEIALDEKVLVTPTSFTVGDNGDVEVQFSNDATKMLVTFKNNVNSIGVLTLAIPFVYNQLETRSMYESQYTQQTLYFTDNGSDIPKEAYLNVRNELYDFNSSVYNPYIKAAVEKIYWTSEGELRVRMNAFYNYGNVTFAEKSRVRIDNSWKKNNFYLDRESIQVFNVSQPIVDGKMNTSPSDPNEGTSIWKYGDPHGANNALQASFADSLTEGWYMQSEQTNKSFYGQSGGFKGSAVAPTDALLIRYELKPYVNFLETVNDLYTVSSKFTATLTEPYAQGTFDSNSELSLETNAIFKIPVTGGGQITTY